MSQRLAGMGLVLVQKEVAEQLLCFGGIKDRQALPAMLHIKSAKEGNA
jgi:hypothetical protein